MNRLQPLWQMLKYFALSAFCWLALYGTVLAKAAPEVKKESTGGWLLSYLLAMMGIILGMLILCKPSRRIDRAKPQEFEESTEKRVSAAELVEEEKKKKEEEKEAEAAKKF